jgi:hypothetical protein
VNDGYRRLWLKISKKEPINREVDAPGHQATCNTERQHKQRDFAPGKIFEHANGFPIGSENTDRRLSFQEKIEAAAVSRTASWHKRGKPMPLDPKKPCARFKATRDRSRNHSAMTNDARRSVR